MALQEKGLFDFTNKALLLKPRTFGVGGRRKGRFVKKDDVVWLADDADVIIIILVAAIFVEFFLFFVGGFVNCD